MTTPFPNLTQNITSLPELLEKTSEISSGEVGVDFALGYMIVLIVTIVAFIGFRSSTNVEIRKILPATLFISYITSTFIATLGMIPDNIPIIPLVGFILSIAMLFYKEKSV